MSLLVRVASRNLLRHPWRTLATVLGVALGIAAVLATLSVGANVEANLAASLELASGDVDLAVVPGSGGRAVFDEDAARERIADVAGVERVRPVLEARAEPLRAGRDATATIVPGIDTGFQLAGRDVSEPENLPAVLASGRFPRPDEAGIALGQAFADARGIELGTRLRLASQAGEIAFTVTGLLDGATGYGATNGGRVGLVPLDVLRRDLRLPGRVSRLEIGVAAGLAVDEAEARLTAALGDAYVVIPPARSGTSATGIVDTLQAGLLVLAATLMALGGFLAYNTFAASVVERRREYALLRTIGFRRRDVHRLALIEAAFVSAAGALAGIALGVVLAWGLTRLNAFVLGFDAQTLVVPIAAVAIATGVGVSVALLAGVLPARTASRTPPLVALQRSEVGHGPTSRSRLFGLLALGLGVAAATAPWAGPWSIVGSGLAMALFFVSIALLTEDLLQPTLVVLRPLLRRSMGVAGRLGADLARRNTERNSVAVGTVIVGVALIIGVASMVEGVGGAIETWVDGTVVGDLFVTGPVGFPDGFDAHVGALDGVDAVSGVALRVVRLALEDAPRGRSVALILVDPARFDPDDGFGSFQFIGGQGDERSGHAALARGDVLAGSTLHARFGFGAGDSVDLRTSDGFAPFRVGGVVVDFTGGGEAFIGSIDALARFGGGSPDLYVITVDDGADPAGVRESIAAAFPDLALDITRNDAYRDRILDASQRAFASTNALLLLAALIAALGVANTLGMSLVTRRHEIAVLRTVGLRRSGVLRMIVAEGIVVVTLGTALGVAVGLVLSRVITAGAAALTGYDLAPVYPWGIVALVVVLAPVVGIVASLLPARRAARIAPIDALDRAD